VPGADPPRLGSTYQYIGEVDTSGGGGGGGGGGGVGGVEGEGGDASSSVVLRARVARCVDGLDVGCVGFRNL
jgi:hypothetical protein